MFGEIVSCVISETRCIEKTGYTCELGRSGVRRRKCVEVEGEENMSMFPSS